MVGMTFLCLNCAVWMRLSRRVSWRMEGSCWRLCDKIFMSQRSEENAILFFFPKLEDCTNLWRMVEDGEGGTVEGMVKEVP